MERDLDRQQFLIDIDVVRRWDRAFESGSDKRFPSLDLVRLEQWYFESKPGLVLDYGCGSGVNLIYLLERGYQVEGVDASMEAVKVVERKLQSRPDISSKAKITHLDPELLSLPFDDGSFDYVVCLSVLSLLGTRERVVHMLQEFHRIMKPGGQAVLDVNGPDSDFAKKGPLLSEDVYEYVEGPDRTVIRSYCPADEGRFHNLLRPLFQVDDIGFTAHKYVGRENLEYIACARKP